MNTYARLRSDWQLTPDQVAERINVMTGGTVSGSRILDYECGHVVPSHIKSAYIMLALEQGFKRAAVKAAA